MMIIVIASIIIVTTLIIIMMRNEKFSYLRIKIKFIGLEIEVKKENKQQTNK